MTPRQYLAAFLLVPLFMPLGPELLPHGLPASGTTAHAQPMQAEQTVSGQVLDPKGRPLANVFVRQEGAIAAGFTDAAGRYSLLLAPGASPVLLFSADGYQLERLPLSAARKVSLKSVETYLPQYRPLLAAAMDPVSSARPLDSQFQLAMQAGAFEGRFAGNRLAATLDNQLALSGQLRMDAWLLGASFERFKASMALPTLPSADAAATEESGIRLRVGYPLGGATWEVAPSLAFMSTHVAAANLPLSGTPYDYTHERRAFGLEAPFTWELGDRLDLVGSAAYYPALSFTSARAPYALSGTSLWEAGLGVGYAIAPALRLDLRYRHQGGGGDVILSRDEVALGVTYRPERSQP